MPRIMVIRYCGEHLALWIIADRVSWVYLVPLLANECTIKIPFKLRTEHSDGDPLHVQRNSTLLCEMEVISKLGSAPRRTKPCSGLGGWIHLPVYGREGMGSRPEPVRGSNISILILMTETVKFHLFYIHLDFIFPPFTYIEGTRKEKKQQARKMRFAMTGGEREGA